jgi:hypothetical protein
MSWRDKAENQQAPSGWRAKAEDLRSKLESQPQKPSFSNVNQYKSADVGFWNRFIAKNFAGDTKAAAAYIKQQKPELDVSVFDNEVVIRKKGETNWQPLDSSSLEFQDITDAFTDVLGGAAQGLATTAAAIPAGLATGGVAALPAGSAASAASGAGLEAARMGIGSALGIPDNFKGENVGWAGGLGAVFPLAFGVDNLTKSLQQSGRGLIKRGIDKVGPSLTEIFSGIDQPTQEYFKANKSKIADIYEKGGDVNLVKSGGEKLFNYAKETKDILAKRAGETKMSAKAVDFSKVMKTIKDAADEYKPENFKAKYGDNPNISQAAIGERLNNIYDDLFKLSKPDFENIKNTPEGKALFTEIDSLLTVSPEKTPANFSVMDKNLPAKRITQDFSNYPGSNENFLNEINSYVRGQTDEQIAQLNLEAKALAKAANISEERAKQQLLASKLKDLGSLARTEKNPVQAGPAAFDLFQQLKTYNKAIQEGNKRGDLSESQRAVLQKIGQPINQAYGAAQEAFDVATGGASQKAANEYANFMGPLGEYNIIKKGITTSGELDPQKTYQTLVRLGQPSKRNMLGVIENLRGKGAINFEEPNQLRALNAFYGPNENSFLVGAGEVQPRKTAIQTALAAIFSLGGYKLGGGYTGAALGGGAGVIGGQGLSSKAAARAYMKLGSAIDRAAQSPWLNNQYLNPTRPALNPWLYQTEEQP